jgi:hypothetical protein
MTKPIIDLCNKIDNLCKQFDPAHVANIADPLNAWTAMDSVDRSIARLAMMEATDVVGLYRKITMLAGLCDADTHPRTGGIANLLDRLELQDPAAFDYWPKAYAELMNAVEDVMNPMNARLLDSIQRDIENLKPA